MMRAEIILFDGFADLDAFVPSEILRRATAAGADVSVDYVTVDGASSALSTFDLTVATPHTLGAPSPQPSPRRTRAARSLPPSARARCWRARRASCVDDTPPPTAAPSPTCARRAPRSSPRVWWTMATSSRQAASPLASSLRSGWSSVSSAPRWRWRSRANWNMSAGEPSGDGNSSAGG